MEVFEISGFPSGIDRSGVNFLDPIYAFENIQNGYVYRQELQSRLGLERFGNRLSDGSRVMGIFEHILPDGEKDLLVCSKEYLYKYNEGTNQFDQIANNSADPFVSFGISANDYYVSGTSYPFPDGSQRFVFTGIGMDDIYFYDGTDVKRFTNATDNPDYEAPASGVLTNATYVLWFGERLNIFVPVIDGISQRQQMLYSGIRDVSGNGDKFNVVGSGAVNLDTYEYITGASIAGDFLLLNLNRSAWTIEKTRDVYNPYFARKVPSVLGTDAPFSATMWGDKVQSVGKTGIMVCDGRQNLRCDDMIPYFTSDDIDQDEFNLCYGGFDRINSQFLLSFRSNESNAPSSTQDAVLVRNYEEKTWSLNDMRLSVFGQTDKGQNLTWNQIDETINPSWARWDTTEEIWNRIGVNSSTQKTLAGDNYGFVYQLNQDYDDEFVDISNITAANPAVITVSPCAMQVGDSVYIQNVEGMTELNDRFFTVVAIGTTSGATTSITIDEDSSSYTAYTTGGSVSIPIRFYAELSPFNPYRDIGRKVRISHVEFLLNSNEGELLVNFYEDEQETPFKADVPITSTAVPQARQWTCVTVNQECNFFTMTMERTSATDPIVITSIRIHCEQGGFTNA